MKHKQAQSGFTLIEMIVSLGVFSVVVTIAVGALLVLIAANRQLQEEQGILTNLAFALDSMTRELRTGSHYYCVSANTRTGTGQVFDDSAPYYDLDNLDDTDVNDCYDGRNPASLNFQGVAFFEGGDSITGASVNRILYYFDQTDNTIYRRVGAQAPESIVSDGIYIVDAEFFVSGSDPLLDAASTDDHQSSVTIFIQAAKSSDPTEKQHRIQTTVVQRTLDI